MSTRLLGAPFRFETDSRALLDLVRDAYAGLPAQRFAHAPPLSVRLVTVPGAGRQPRSAPPLVHPLGGREILAGVMGGSSFVAIDSARREALVAVAEPRLRFGYHVRYELIEFAAYMLAARAQGLVPLHAACVGRAGRGLLLLGPSGAGKSTLMLQALLHGLEFLSEDSVLVRPDGLRATGVANFLHVRKDSLRFIDSARLRQRIGDSPVIRRRSGARKYALDLRGGPFRLAAGPLQLCALVFLTATRATPAQLLLPLSPSMLGRRLRREQPYAAQQAGWRAFVSGAAGLPAFELRRAAHPRQAVAVLEGLLGAPAGTAASR